MSEKKNDITIKIRFHIQSIGTACALAATGIKCAALSPMYKRTDARMVDIPTTMKCRILFS